MNQQPPRPVHTPPPRRRMSRAAIQRRRRRRALRRLAGLTVVLMLAAGGTAYLLPRLTAPKAVEPAASSPALAAGPVASTALVTQPDTAAQAQPAGPLGAMTPAEAQSMLADPLMVLVNHTCPMPEGYTVDTPACGSTTSLNKTLQTAACDAFLSMQAAAAAENVTIWMQSGYRSVDYQAKLYRNKTQYYLDQGFDEATAKEKAAAIVNPPGYSEHNCGLAADLNSPEHTGLDEGFENTAAFRWLCEHAGEYGFILRYPKGREDVTEITYEPWHWRYVGVENAARVNASGLCFEEYIAALQALAAQG